MGVKRYPRHRWVYRDKRWPGLRLAAKRRDDWRCVQCGSKYRLEVDHILPVRDREDLAFILSNLQTLCGPCHGRKTAQETGIAPMNPARKAWLKAVDELRR